MIPSSADQALRWVRKKLQMANIRDAEQDALSLFSYVSGLDKTDILRDPNLPLTRIELTQLTDLVEQRIAGKPVGRILGLRNFMGLDLALNEATLEPRFDTEVLVLEAYAWLSEREMTKVPEVLDIGTGSGAIALGLMKLHSTVHVIGTDIAVNALDIAKQNAIVHGFAARFQTLESNYFSEVSGLFDLIVSNPPYIATAVIESLEDEVKQHDPHLALDGGADGLDAYRILARDGRAYLAANGLIAVEIGYDQSNDVEAIFDNAGFRLMKLSKDFNGHDRVMLFA